MVKNWTFEGFSGTVHCTTRKRGEKAGKARLWLEGKILAEAGFIKGEQFSAVRVGDVLVLKVNHFGKRKISGKGDTHAIIDIVGKDVEFLPEQVEVRYVKGNGHITVQEIETKELMDV